MHMDTHKNSKEEGKKLWKPNWHLLCYSVNYIVCFYRGSFIRFLGCFSNSLACPLPLSLTHCFTLLFAQEQLFLEVLYSMNFFLCIYNFFIRARFSRAFLLIAMNGQFLIFLPCCSRTGQDYWFKYPLDWSGIRDEWMGAFVSGWMVCLIHIQTAPSPTIIVSFCTQNAFCCWNIVSVINMEKMAHFWSNSSIGWHFCYFC